MGLNNEGIGRKGINAVVAGGSVRDLVGIGEVVAAYVGTWKPGGGVCTVERIRGGPE